MSFHGYLWEGTGLVAGRSRGCPSQVTEAAETAAKKWGGAVSRALFSQEKMLELTSGPAILAFLKGPQSQFTYCLIEAVVVLTLIILKQRALHLGWRLLDEGSEFSWMPEHSHYQLSAQYPKRLLIAVPSEQQKMLGLYVSACHYRASDFVCRSFFFRR